MVEATKKTRLGPPRLSVYWRKHEGSEVPAGTIRHILRRNPGELPGATPRERRKREKREFTYWYSVQPFEIAQMYVKYVRDQKAPGRQQIIHPDRCAIPNYQWGAIDVHSRFKLIASPPKENVDQRFVLLFVGPLPVQTAPGHRTDCPHLITARSPGVNHSSRFRICAYSPPDLAAA